MRVTVAEIIQALRATGGRMEAASKQLGIGYETLRKRIRDSKRLQAEAAAIQGRHNETGEGNILRDMYSGDTAASKWWLERKGKHLGWSTRTELTGPDNTPLDFGVENLSEAEIAELARLLGRPKG